MAGYIGPAPVPQATQTREVFTLSSTQTTVGTGGYTPGFVDVYLNGAKLAPADFTATNGSDIVLASAAAANDILEVVAFQEFTVVDQTFSGDITFTGANYNVVWDASDNALEFADNAKAVFGAGSDLQIYHNGSASFIDDAGTGYLNIRGSGVSINKYTGETMALFVADGAASLYHDNAAKLATTSTGIDVTGTLVSDGLTVSGDAVFTPDNDGVRITGANYATLRLEENDTTDLNTTIFNSSGAFSLYTSNDARSSLTQRLNIDHSTGDIGFYEDTGSTAKLSWSASNERLTLDGSDYQFSISQGSNQPFFLRAVSDGSFRIHLNGTGDSIIVDSSSRVGIGGAPDVPLLIGKTASDHTSAAVTIKNLQTGGYGSILNFESTNTSGSAITAASIGTEGAENYSSTDTTSSHLKFSTVGDGVLAERMRIKSTGEILHTLPSEDTTFAAGTESTWNRFEIFQDRGAADTASGIAFRSQSGTAPAGIVSVALNTTGGREELAFITSAGNTSAERMRIDENGNVGIGQSPNMKLNILHADEDGIRLNTADGAASFIDFGDVSDNDIGRISYDHADNHMAFRTNNAEAMRIDSSGTLTTPSGVDFNIMSASGMTLGSTTSIVNFKTNNTEKMRIDSNGRVGIKTSANASFDQVAGADLFVLGSGAGDQGMTIYSGNAGTGNIMFADGTTTSDQYEGYIQYVHADNRLLFGSNHATRMTVENNGDVTIEDGDLIIGTAGHGIDFSAQTATSASGTSTSSELLDHYEEGTFTPDVGSASGSGGSATSKVGKFTRIGNRVFADFSLVVSSLGSMSGNFFIVGFPFPNNANFVGEQGPVRSQGLGGSNDIPVTFEMLSNGSYGRFHFASGTSTQRTVQVSDVSSGDFIAASICYIV